MRYLANASSPLIRAAMRTEDWLGQMCTPAEGRAPLPTTYFALDNGCYGQGWPGEDRWWAWVVRHVDYAARCLFVTAPDVVGDAAATLARSAPWLPQIRRLGLPVALVAQDGLERLRPPWRLIDTLFIGASTHWKLGPEAAELIREAQARHKTIHMGRINSWSRWAYAESLCVDSADGTSLTYAPDTNLARLRAWHSRTHRASPAPRGDSLAA